MIAEGSSKSGERAGEENDGRKSERRRRRRERGGAEREKKKRIALRSASRCRVHRFRLPSATLIGHSDPCTDIYIQAHAHIHTEPPNITKRSVKGHADVHACQIIICNCRAG